MNYSDIAGNVSDIVGNVSDIVGNVSDIPFLSNENRTKVLLCRNSTWAVITQTSITITAMLGLIGNTLSLIVLRMPKMKSAYSLLLCALTLSDSAQLVVHIIHFSCPVLGISTVGMDPISIKAISMVAYIALTASSYFTVLLSFERYTAVCNPFKALSIFPTTRRMFYYIIAIIVFALLFNLPKWWEVIPSRDVKTGVARLIPSPLKKNSVYAGLYVFWANVCVNFLIPLVILAILNSFIYKGILEANKTKRSLSKGQAHKQDMSITFMLIIVVVVFCICNMFYTVIGCIMYFFSTSSLILTRIQNYLYSFNASVNFAIYCLCGSKFRHQLCILCQDIRKKTGCGGKYETSMRQPTRSSIIGTSV